MAQGAVSSEALPLPESIRTRGKGLRPIVRTVTEGLRLIDRELPAELRSLPRWTLARALLVQAERSGKKRDLITAARQLRQALSNEAVAESESQRGDKNAEIQAGKQENGSHEPDGRKGPWDVG
jgi:hypothetical protein